MAFWNCLRRQCWQAVKLVVATLVFILLLLVALLFSIGPWYLYVRFAVIPSVKRLRHWPATKCHFVNVTITCAEDAQSRPVGKSDKDCRDNYCVNLIVRQDHFKEWPAVPLEREDYDACDYENRCGKRIPFHLIVISSL